MADTDAVDQEPVKKDKRGFWLNELELSEKSERKWRQTAAKIEDLYESEKQTVTTDTARGKSSNMNIFFSNTETLRPALYSSTPAPDVRRTFPQEDDTAKHVAQVIERSISVTLDQADFDDEMEQVVTDHLVTGRGVVRLDYEVETRTVTDRERTPIIADGGGFVMPDGRVLDETELPGDIEQTEDGGLEMLGDEVKHEEFVREKIIPRRVQWDDFRMSGNAKRWDQVWWVAFRHEMTVADMVSNRIPKKLAKATNLEIKPADTDGSGTKDKDQRDSLNRAEVWEIWNKRDRTRLFVSKGHADDVLLEEPDPLGLVDFFPIPKPLYSIRRLRSLVPIPEYVTYSDQAVELHKTTARIDRIVDAIKVRGLFDQSMGEISKLLDGPENKMVAVSNWGAFVDKGGLQGVVDWMPIDQLVAVLAQLYQQRAQLIQTIYEITGISDIIRGATDPRETASAQQLKGQYGQMRLSPRQRRVERMARGMFRIIAEIVAEKFSASTLQAMTGLEVTDEHMELMKSDQLRNYRIDVETDSTVLPNDQKGKEEVTEFLGSLGGFMEIIAPMVQAGIMPAEVAKLLMLWAARRFKVSREVEDAMEQIGNQPPPEEGDPEADKDAAEQGLKAQELQMKAQQGQAELDAQIAQAQGEQQVELLKIKLEAMQAEKDREVRLLELRIKAAEVQNRPKAA